MKSKRTVLRKLTAGILAAVLLAGPVQASNPEIRVSSYKGTTLEAGERSGLIIGPSGADYNVTSSNPETVALEKVLTFWVAVAKNPGTATINVTNSNGNKGSLTLTVEKAPPSEIDLTANMDIRLKMVEYINQVRRENGKAELPINEALMNSAQDVSTQCVTEHRPYDHQILSLYGWPHGAMYNLASLGCYDGLDVARQAVEIWIDSPGHFETMLMEEASCIGTGVTFDGGRAYCYMVVGNPNSYNFYG